MHVGNKHLSYVKLIVRICWELLSLDEWNMVWDEIVLRAWQTGWEDDDRIAKLRRFLSRMENGNADHSYLMKELFREGVSPPEKIEHLWDFLLGASTEFNKEEWAEMLDLLERSNAEYTSQIQLEMLSDWYLVEEKRFAAMTKSRKM